MSQTGGPTESLSFSAQIFARLEMPPTPPPNFSPHPRPHGRDGTIPTCHMQFLRPPPVAMAKQVPLGHGASHGMLVLSTTSPSSPPHPPPQNHFLGHPSCLPRVLFPCSLQRSTQGFVTVSTPLPFLLRIILYSSFQTIQYSLGYSYYYQVAGIVKVGVVRALAFIPYFFVLLSMCINY